MNFTRILGSVTKGTTLADDVDREQDAARAATKAEKEQLTRHKLPLAAFIHESLSLQVQALYAVQVFCHTNSFPKGILPVAQFQHADLLRRNYMHLFFVK